MDEFVFVDRSDDVIENFGPEEMKFEDDSDSEVEYLGLKIAKSDNSPHHNKCNTMVFDNFSENFGSEEMIYFKMTAIAK